MKTFTKLPVILDLQVKTVNRIYVNFLTMVKMKQIAIYFLLAFILHQIVAAGAIDFSDYEIKMYESGIEYHFYNGTAYLGEDREELMDIYSPVSTISGIRPAVILIHGGGWGTGGRLDARARQAAEYFVGKGYVAASIEYKLTTYEAAPLSSPKVEGAWAQNIYDCKTAVRFLKKYSGELNIDSNKIIVMGFSAGGHLAMLTGYSSGSDELNSGGLYTEQSNDVYGIISFYGIPDVRIWGGEAFIDVSQQQAPEVWALASPVEHTKWNSPPILIVHGTVDTTVAIAQSESFVDILSAKKARYVYVPVEGAGHSFGLMPPQMDLRGVIDDFLSMDFEQWEVELACGDFGILPADFNVDCEVNIKDFYIFANNWIFSKS